MFVNFDVVSFKNKSYFLAGTFKIHEKIPLLKRGVCDILSSAIIS